MTESSITIETVAREIVMARSAQRRAQSREVFDSCQAEIDRLNAILENLKAGE